MAKVGKLLTQYDSCGDDETGFDWEDMMYELKDILNKKSKGIPQYWYAEVKNQGWQKRSGYKYFKVTSPSDFLSKILPDTDNTFTIYNYGKGIAINNSHHDAPTGEWYYIVPISEKTFYQENHKKMEID